jgi:hypothetical protein
MELAFEFPRGDAGNGGLGLCLPDVVQALVMGALTASIAHEPNQPLAGIITLAKIGVCPTRRHCAKC